MYLRKILFYSFIVFIISFELSYAISTLSGFVRDANGAPVASVDLDFFDMQTGVKLVTPGDNTDINGFYSVTVLNSTFYRVTFAPSQGNSLLGKQFFNFDLSTSMALDVQLESGITISGIISDSLGNPIGEADIDVDSIGGGRVFTPDDNSFIVDGSYSVVVPQGLFRIRYDSPVNSSFLGVQLDTVIVFTDTTINITMSTAHNLTGTVTDLSSSGVFNVDIDLRDAVTGSKIFTSNNSTDTLGNYNVVVNSGLYQLRFAPARGSRYVGKLIDSVSIITDRIYDEVLEEGLLCTVRIVDTLGNPVAGVDIDVKLSESGAKLYTPNDKTTATGETIVTVQQGLYDLQFDPPLGSTFQQILIPNVSLNQDTLIELVMVQVVNVNFSGQIIDNSLSGLGNIKLSLVTPTTSSKIYLVGNITDSLGLFDIQVPQGTFNLQISPPRGSHYIAQEFKEVNFTTDTLSGQIILEDGSLVTLIVVDELDSPLPSTDIDISLPNTTQELFTPNDYTDMNGVAEVVLPQGWYDIVAIPNASTKLGSEILPNYFIEDGDSVTIHLSHKKSEANDDDFILYQNQPNPFNSSTIIRFDIMSPTDVQVDIYNILGQKVKSLVDNYYPTGVYAVQWDGTDKRNKKVASGLYFYQIVTSQGANARKAVLLK